jgi:hypothetical protein
MDVMEVKLSELEEKLLAVAASAGGNRLTIQELADKCKCKPATIHKKLQEEEFKQLFLETLKGSLISDIPDILNSFVKEAKDGSFKHGELLLELAGVHKKEVNANVGIKFRQIEGDENPFTDESEKVKFLKGVLARLSAGLVEEEDE